MYTVFLMPSLVVFSESNIFDIFENSKEFEDSPFAIQNIIKEDEH